MVDNPARTASNLLTMRFEEERWLPTTSLFALCGKWCA
ncbi:hypothetical protein SF83666_b47400 (plasmid) [Sinorhizobium fredii CCBAU 83666]|nr:hypothetical protein SF83666_b47400 [Sinorhizobium fredii CCBAU 83666]